LEQLLSNEGSIASSRSSTSYQTKSTNVSYKMHKTSHKNLTEYVELLTQRMRQKICWKNK